MKTRLILTCEHGGNQIPEPYLPYFRGSQSVLKTHRGWDPGALDLAKKLAGALEAELHYCEVSRLVIELNRSLGHPRLFSEFMRQAPEPIRDRAFAEMYRPYRSFVTEALKKGTKRGVRVLHVSVHSFTPNLDGVSRNADIGLLYDPSREGEKSLCRLWRTELLREIRPHPSFPRLAVRMNYPYRGTSDGFTTSLRKQFSGDEYLGIELEVNQRFPLGAKAPWNSLKVAIAASLKSVLRSLNHST